jgi:ferric-dicitrate binding protein FerR (iron transport regulator)
MAVAASVIVAVALIFGPTRSPITETAALAPDPARVEAVLGSATFRAYASEEETQFVEAGETVPVGSEIVTSSEGRLALHMPSGHSIRVDASTRVRLVDADSVLLEHGALYVDSGVEPDARKTIAVETPFGIVREIGTQFVVRLERHSVRVRVREGRAVLSGEGPDREIEAGHELVVAAGGPSSTRAISTHGPAWDWIADITPMPDFQGRSAKEFLDWIARERGWSLGFSDAAVAREADRIVLGSLGNLTLDQALDAVLPTCLMVYRVEDGTLWVASDDGVRVR